MFAIGSTAGSFATEPLIKSLMLQCNLIAAYWALQQPTPDPSSTEQARFRRESAGEVLPGLLVWGGLLVKYTLYALFSTETAVLLVAYAPRASWFPSWLALPATAVHAAAALAPRLHASPYFTLGTVLVCGGGLVRRACYRALGRRFTFRLALRADHALETRGPYAVVRHPAYGGALAFVAGAYMCVRDRASLLAALGLWDTRVGTVLRFAAVVLAVLAASAFVDRARVEDEALKRKFGVQWERWAKRTPYKLIPFIF
ncbi:isoprenylcysteine carboxylmethyltransferase family protein [Phanerochaete sordida]|uniref:Isoprenylcysteine carboxylmethyltransferase family protein n=1 Tax=Phanerochaete sordida TaxID=48140 RepID=A0A9P3GC88_9APHY|nr:isoprenylcysteine carboxylmethyltransferase family protein [Phanerochaete sordida]